jgi:uncharacterized membrane protein YhaH (DUF805 family)
MNYYFEVLKKYAQFNGRARRKEFWYFILFNSIATMIFAIIGIAAHVPYLNNIYSLAVFIPYLAVTIRRMHDVGKSGWYCIIPIYNLILACTDGTPGENEYGEDPKGGTGFGADDYVKPFDINPA